ncbi:MAG: peptidase S53 [Acidobacteriota bacterium]|nr:peptidase S53 [Acidobacteriota bacterium]
MTRITLPSFKGLGCLGLFAVCILAVNSLSGQSLPSRLSTDLSTSQMTTLKGTLLPMVRPEFDAGAMPVGKKIEGMTFAFNRSVAQQAALSQLIADQQNPASPLYHQWLTPEQFAIRFGMAQSDIDKVEAWLQQQGFTIDSVARSRTFIRFSGTVGQVNQAFGTQMHYYNVDGKQHFAPSTALKVPATLAPVVSGIGNLNTFRPRSMRVPRPKADFTSSSSGNVFFTPGDIKVAYDVNPLVNGGFDGTGQSITIVGQSAVVTSDITNFQTAAGLTPKAPTTTLVPNTGISATSAGDEGESDLDLEWSSAMAPGANVTFVYTGNNTNASVFDSINYAVDQHIGNIISVSYGACEPVLGGYSIETTLQQAAVQGQTVVVSSGDSGASACYGFSSLSTATQQSVSVSYPASSPFVTALGGTEISSAQTAYTTSGSAYWAAKSSTDVITSALQYLPEVVWNDDPQSGSVSASQGGGLSATGGGASILFGKPSYQGALTPADGARDIPDVSLYSSPYNVAYLYCTSDTTNWGTSSSGVKQAASCNSGFRDSTTGLLTAAGGTSFAAPVFAGMVALINQAKGYTNGQGIINTTLYSLAANSATYAAAFHDTTTGTNACTAGTTYGFCTIDGPTMGFAAGTKYDQATGLGSVDLNALVTVWPTQASVGTLLPTTVTITPSTTTPAPNASMSFAIRVSSADGGSSPTGNVSISVDGGTAVSGTLASGAYTYTTSFASGTHTISVSYGGDGGHAASGTASATVYVGNFTVAAGNITVKAGSSGTSTVTVTPNGYTGTVTFGLSTSNSNLTNACYTINDATVTGTSAATTTLTIYTSSSSCSTAAVQSGTGANARTVPGVRYRITGPSGHAQISPAAPISRAALGFLALLLAGLIGWRFRKARLFAAVLVLAAAGFALSGCGGGGSSSTTNGGGSSTNAPTGTYSLTVTGADSVHTTLSASTSITLTVN